MSPQVTAAIIAASVGVITLIATVVTQYLGRRATSRDTQKALEAQRVQLDRTLAEQRTRTLNERFATAAGQLGSDKPAAVRLAGVYAMAGLADDWPENRQTCVDVLCGYMRMPYEADPGRDAPDPERLAFRASREVRLTAISVITAHLKDDAAVSWQGLNFDFRRVIFDGGSFRGAVFPGGGVRFESAEFSCGTVDFTEVSFSGGAVNFDGAKFSGGTAKFIRTKFSGGIVHFGGAEFSGGIVDFRLAEFSGGKVFFHGAEFSGGQVYFGQAKFSGGAVDFDGAKFSGSKVLFHGAEFSGGTVEFSRSDDWSVPPVFPWADAPPPDQLPPGVKLPQEEDQPRA
jgi:Pentapeptide repeats (9 copies)